MRCQKGVDKNKAPTLIKTNSNIVLKCIGSKNIVSLILEQTPHPPLTRSALPPGGRLTVSIISAPLSLLQWEKVARATRVTDEVSKKGVDKNKTPMLIKTNSNIMLKYIGSKNIASVIREQTPHPPLTRSPFPRWGRLSVSAISAALFFM